MPLPLGLPVIPAMFGAVFLLSSVWALSAKADDSEVLDVTEQNWREKAPEGGSFASEARERGAVTGACPSGWSCAPGGPRAAVPQNTQEECSSRLSRCGRLQRGGGGGGGD